MSVDALIKKYFLVIAGLAVAFAAFLQAGAVSRLLGVAIAPAGATRAAALAAGPRKTTAFGATGDRKSAKDILDRNVFDSVTGPLKAPSVASADGPGDQEDDTPVVTDPAQAPGCKGVAVNIITESTDPLWSIAVLKGDGDSEPTLRRVGDEVGGKKVVYIGYNPLERSPSVWLKDGARLCQCLLFETQPEVKSAPKKKDDKKDDKKKPKKRRKRRRGPPPIPKEMADKIQKVSDTEFNVDRSLVDTVIKNQAMLMKQARIVPEQRNGKVVGVRLFGIRNDTLLGTLGLQNGDRLETLNGFQMGSPEKALEAYARLRTADKLAVQVNRRGKPVTIDINIK